MFQSPSLRGSGRFSTSRRAGGSWWLTSFNPLHCGAVVASRTLVNALRRAIPVSIPFIAGQWSLLAARALGIGRTTMFQSPSLRGSGRFRRPSPRASRRRGAFQSPSLRGSGRFGSTGGADEDIAWFQSPSLRGSGRFRRARARRPRRGPRFNPLHCGAVVASPKVWDIWGPRVEVSIPFIAGQWSLLLTAPSRRTAGGQVSIPFIAGQWSLP